MYGCLPENMPVYHVSALCLQRPKGVRYPGTAITDGCEHQVDTGNQT